MKIKILHLLLILQLQLFSPKLIFVYEMCRHGDRSPYSVINGTDVLYQKWKYQANLTKYGMRQQYEIGQQMREKYINKLNFLSQNYSSNEIYMNASGYDRCQLSGYSQFIGLYPQEILTNSTFEVNSTLRNEQYLNITDGDIETLHNVVNKAFREKGLFPVNIITDHRLDGLQHGRYCKGDIARQAANNNKPILLNYLSNFTKNYSNIVKEITRVNFSNYLDSYDYFDAFICDYRDRRNMSYIDPDQEKMYNICTTFIGHDMFYSEYGDPHEKVAITAISPLLRYLFNYIDNFIQNLNRPNQSPKFIIHELIDENIAALQIALMYIMKLPLQVQYIDFSSHYFLEIHQDDSNGDFYLHIIYNGVKIYDDLYSNFKSQITPGLFTPEQINQFCEISENFLQ